LPEYPYCTVRPSGASILIILPPDQVTYSPNVPLPEETISTLGDMGYRVIPHWYPYGDLQIVVSNDDGVQAAADPRKRGEARVLP